MSTGDQTRNIVILGAGAMGCLFAARLGISGHDVKLVDVDQQRIDTINKHGLVLDDDAGQAHVDLRACKAAELGGQVDLLIVFTKGNHTRAAVESIAAIAAQNPIALSLQNGLGNADIIAETFGWERTLFGTAHIPADLLPPNVVRTHKPDDLAIGGVADSSAALALDVAEMMNEAGFTAQASSDIRKTVWEKLAFNAALNAPAMIAEKANGGLANSYGLSIARSVIAEAVAVAQANDIALDAAEIDAVVCAALEGHKLHKASMFQDREAGRLTEIDMINGAIVREGEKAGVATPVCSTLTNLVRLIEHSEG